MKSETAILVLAAGSSSRMGKAKQLLPFKNETLLNNVLQTAITANIGKVYCVLGANFKVVNDSIQGQLPVKAIENPKWALGMGSSIKCGLQKIREKEPRLKNLLITLADQPLVSSNHLTNLVQASNRFPNKIIATRYKNKKGVPALFPFNFFDNISQIHDQFGSKQLINQSDNAIAIDCDLKELFDIDTPTDYKTLTNETEINK
ncbi:MAG: nucleotidyltransferase family protein [Bacteroidia bacterium]